MNAIIKRGPTGALTMVRPFYRPFGLMDEVERMARDIWDSWRPVASTSFMPRLDIYEEKDELVIKAELPGVRKQDLDINLEGDILTIKAEKKSEEIAEDATYYSRERHFGQFSRSISLPFYVDADKISATFKSGILAIRLPKAEEAKSRHVEVK